MFKDSFTKSSLKKSAIPNFDFNTLTPQSFLICKKNFKARFFSSEIREATFPIQLNEPQINYQKLISKRYDAKKFKIFMRLFLELEEIILEEKNTQEIAKEIKDNPFKCYSFREDEQIKTPIKNLLNEVTDSNRSVMNTTLNNTPNDFGSFNQESMRPVTSSVSKTDLSFKSFDTNDFLSMNDSQIKELVDRKMKKLENYNDVLEKRYLKTTALVGLLSERHLQAIVIFQKRLRGMVLKKKFFKALRMNDFFEQKKNYLKLKKSVSVYQERRKEGLVDMFMIPQ